MQTFDYQNSLLIDHLTKIITLMQYRHNYPTFQIVVQINEQIIIL